MAKFAQAMLSIFILTVSTGCAGFAPKLSIKQADAHPTTVIVPRVSTGNSLLAVDVSIAGEAPEPFILDTGATISALIAVKQGDERIRTDVLVYGISDTSGYPVRSVDSLKIGAWGMGPKRLVVLNLRRRPKSQGRAIKGLIGLDILETHILYFNKERDTVSFIKPEHFVPEMVENWHRINLKPNPFLDDDRGLKFVDLDFSDEVLPAIVDTGAEVSFMTWNVGDVARIKAARRSVYETWQLQGAVGAFKPEALFRLKGLKIGDKVFDTEPVVVSDLSSLKVLGFGAEPFFIAGSSLWSRQSFVIDFQNNAMYLKKFVPVRESLTRSSSGVVLRDGKIEID